MSKQIKPFYTLNAYQTSLVLDCRDNAPAILYWGPRLSERTEPDRLAQLSQLEEAPASPPQQAPVSLSPELGLGFQGNPGVEVHRQGQCWGLCAQIKSVTESDNQLTITSLSESADIVITHSLGLEPITGVLTASTQLTNTGDTELSLQRCYAPSIPLPMHLTKILGFKGRWANEFQVQSIDRFVGAYVRENRSGARPMTAFQG